MTPAMREILNVLMDDTAPAWMKGIVRATMDKDPVDIANALSWLTGRFTEHCDTLCERARSNA